MLPASPTIGTLAAGVSAAPRWWRSMPLLERFICDLVAAEFRALRPAGDALPPLPWDGGLHLGRDFGVDSLELLQLASAFAAAIHLHESGVEDHLLARPTLAAWIDVAQAGLEQFSRQISFRTSGSIGQPKTCSHALESLWQEAQALAGLFPGTRRILSAVPGHHIYGFLFTILLPHALGIADVEVIDLRAGSASRLRQIAREGDLAIGHPAFWQAALPAISGIAAGVTGASSTAPCPDALAAGLRAAGLARLVQIFGSSETAGIGWREHETEPFALFDFWQHDRAQEHGLMRRMPDGALARFTGNDNLAWTDERHFLPRGRRDAAVQVGGINVFPGAVRQTLLAHPEVHDAAVRLMRSDEGARLKAFIVPRDRQANQAQLRARLLAWIDTRLSAAERPRALSFGAQCPTGPTGKDADWIIE